MVFFSSGCNGLVEWVLFMFLGLVARAKSIGCLPWGDGIPNQSCFALKENSSVPVAIAHIRGITGDVLENNFLQVLKVSLIKNWVLFEFHWTFPKIVFPDISVLFAGSFRWYYFNISFMQNLLKPFILYLLVLYFHPAIWIFVRVWCLITQNITMF